MSASLMGYFAGAGVFACVAEIGILYLTNRYFRVAGNTFPRASAILLASSLASFPLSAIAFALGLRALDVLAALAFYGVAYMLYRDFFAVTLWKFVRIMATFTIAGAVLSVVVVVPLRLFLFSPFTIDGNSMTPAYPSGEYVVFEMYDRSAHKGDVILYASGEGKDRSFIIGRVTGVAGDIEKGTVVSKGKLFVSKDNVSAIAPGLIPQSAIIGKPVLDIGRSQ